MRQMVEQKGIGYHPEHQVVSVDASARRLVFANGSQAEFDLLVYVPPIGHRPSSARPGWRARAAG
jgi:sulfide:quinone oxidoreductase